MKNNSTLEVAKLGRTVGLRGDLKLHLLSDFVEQFYIGSSFSTKHRGELTVTNFDKNRMLIRFDGYTNKEDAQSLVNAILLSSVEQTRKDCKLGKDEFFWFDLIGLDIIENDLNLGKVEQIQRIAEQDYLLINTHEELIKQGNAKSFLIPYLEHFIIQTSLEKKNIQVQRCFDILQSS